MLDVGNIKSNNLQINWRRILISSLVQGISVAMTGTYIVILYPNI